MDLEKLRRRVEWSTRIAFIIFVFVILAYVGKLWLLSDGKLAGEPEVWGQFGDYVGGLLNPLIAFLAFYWLTQSVLLQKQELTETKDALRDSARSQSDQVLFAKKTAEINALSALLASHDSDLSSYRSDAHFIASQLKNASSTNTVYASSGRTFTYEQAIDEVDLVGQRMQETYFARQEVRFKIEALLDLERR